MGAIAPKPIQLPIRICPTMWRAMRARPDFHEMLERNGLKESDYLVLGPDDLPAMPGLDLFRETVRDPKADP